MLPATCSVAAKVISTETKKFEVAHIFKEHGEAYTAKHPMPLRYKNIMRDIELCRTEYFGGHIDKCDTCGFERDNYNSCRNRHCPKCQTLAKEKWLEARKSELLPIGYFHNVFTFPHDLNPLARYNAKVIYNLLFAAVSQTLIKFGLDPKHIGGRLGFIAILHTWDQRIKQHIHLHVIIPGGALSIDGNKWLFPKKKKKRQKKRTRKKEYLCPVLALSPVFRAIVIKLLEAAYAKGELVFSGEIEQLGTPKGFKRLIQELWKPNWVVYSKEPFAGPDHVLEYLGRYTHKVAISNHRILNIENGMVTFKYRVRKEGDKEKITTISAEKFIQRFLLHILPHGFMRIRHFGFLANRCKKENISKIREQLGTIHRLPEKVEETTVEIIKRLTGVDLTVCPECKKGKMLIVKEIESFRDRTGIWEHCFIDSS